VRHELRTLVTQLRVNALVPAGYDPTGLAVVLTPDDGTPDVSKLERRDDGEQRDTTGLPALMWHRTSADAPGGDAWGVDLRRPEPQMERRDSIVWCSVSATIDAASGALVQGGATGSALVRVQDPFDAGRWELAERRDFAALETTSVAPPVARIDVRAVDGDGPLTRGRAHVDWALAPRASRAGRRSSGRGAQRSDAQVKVEASLDAEGRATLFVPSLASLTVSVSDAIGARTTTRRLAAPGPAGSYFLSLSLDGAGQPDPARR
jgi:hypothetical protein